MRRRTRYGITLPVFGWFLVFFAIPILVVSSLSVFERDTYGGILWNFHFGNFARAMDWMYLRIIWNSIQMAMVTSVLCLLIGYPVAFLIATSPKPLRNPLLFLIMFPFWINLVVRAFGTKLLVVPAGFFNFLLMKLGWTTEPIIFEAQWALVLLGMVTNYLPFLVLPLYVVLEKFDFTLLEAARDLGASGWQILTKILLPLTSRGIKTGLLLVFAPSLGEFVIPDLFGGAKTYYVGSLITDQFLKSRDWPFGATLTLLLVIPVVALLRAQGRKA